MREREREREGERIETDANVSNQPQTQKYYDVRYMHEKSIQKHWVIEGEREREREKWSGNHLLLGNK